MSKKFRFLGFLILIFSVVFTGAASANSIAYRTHVTQYAWQGWVYRSPPSENHLFSKHLINQDQIYIKNAAFCVSVAMKMNRMHLASISRIKFLSPQKFIYE